jgi:hypothetical protein
MTNQNEKKAVDANASLIKGSHRQKPKATVATTSKGNKKTITDSMQKHGNHPTSHDAAMVSSLQALQLAAVMDPMKVDLKHWISALICKVWEIACDMWEH